MEYLQELINEITASLGDSFIALPYLIIGLAFFLGSLTSNIGLLYLFFGHILLVPLVCFLANEPGPPLWPLKKPDFFKVLRWVFSYLAVFTVNGIGTSFGTFGLTGGALVEAQQYLSYGIPIWTLIAQYYDVAFIAKDGEGSVTVFDTLNPYNAFAFFFGWKQPPVPERDCSLIRGSQPPSRASPSNWLIHICFFIGFIISNSIALYNEPVPTLRPTTDSKLNETRQEALNQRVSNRKMITMMICLMAITLFCVLVFTRRFLTNCEDGFWLSYFPILFVLITGGAWFSFLKKTCGIRPADVLGIVQGMISPELIDNPIICTGS